MGHSEQGASGARSFLGRSVTLSVLAALESLVGFAVDASLAAGFGLSSGADAFYAAWLLPRQIGRGVFGNLPTAFLGHFSGQEEHEEAFGQALAVIGAVTLSAAAILAITSAWWLPWVIPGAAQETKRVAVHLARVLCWLIAFLALAETLRAICYQKGQLWLPALARLLGGVLTVVVVLVAAQARNLLWAAWGVTAGAVLEATADLAGVAFLLHVRLRLRWPTPRALRDMAGLVGASLSGPGIWTAAETIERGFASFLPAGSIAALSYARRIVATLTHLAFRGFVISTIQMQLSTIKAQLRAHARLVVLAAIPIAIILLALSGPLVAIVFERLGFTSLEVQVLAGALRPYALAVVGIALSRIPFGMAYAQKQAQAILSYFLVLSVALVLVDAVALYLGVGVPSFGLGYSIAQWCGLVWLVFSVLPRGQRAFLTRTDAIQLMLVGLSGWVGSWALAALIQRRTAGSRWADWFVLAAGAVGCGTGLLISAWALRLEEARQLVRLAGEEWR